MLEDGLGCAVGIFGDAGIAHGLTEMLGGVELALVVGHGAVAAEGFAAGFGLQFAGGGSFAFFGGGFAKFVEVVLEQAGFHHVVGDPALAGFGKVGVTADAADAALHVADGGFLGVEADEKGAAAIDVAFAFGHFVGGILQI